ncbi:hypothetical protein EON80_09505 [bacterium]|nr:MAG: hypothetical protein EON80_09505 [bacterium]
MNEAPSTPKWETAVMVGSFLLIWAYYLARQKANMSGDGLHIAWNVALGAAVVALVVIFIRRLQRTLVLLRSSGAARRR